MESFFFVVVGKTEVLTALRSLSSLMFRIKIDNDRRAVGTSAFSKKKKVHIFDIFLQFLLHIFEYQEFSGAIELN